MNKTDLIAYAADRAGMPKARVASVFDAMMAGIEKGLRDNGKVTIQGFGTFKVRHRAARKGVNPSTGQPIQIPASKSVGFSAGKGLKGAV